MQIVFHIGMPRTGTTFLQTKIFPGLKKTNYINTSYEYRKKDIKHKNLNDVLLNINNLSAEELKGKIDPFLSAKKPNLISREQLYSDVFQKEDDRIERLQKIKKMYPNTKIIFGIRDKHSLEVSWYNKYIVNGGVLLFSVYKNNIVNKNKLCFNKYIVELKKMFGGDNVHIYEFEKLFRDNYCEIKKICCFLNEEMPFFDNKRSNVGYGKTRIFLSLFLNHLFKTKQNPNGLIKIRSHGLLPHRFLFMSRFFHSFRKPYVSELYDIENRLKGWKFWKNNVK